MNKQLIQEGALSVKAYFSKLFDSVFHPLKNMPVPDFNYQCDFEIL